MSALLVVSPHQDDAAFSIGTTLEALAQAEWRICVRNVFSISQYALTLPASASVDEVCRIRADEDRAFADHLAGRRITIESLNRLDAPLREPYKNLRTKLPLTERESREATYVADQLRTASDFQTSAVLLPLALGDHVDHRIVHEAGRRAASCNALLGFYEDLPYAGWLSLESIQSTVVSIAASFDVELIPVLCGHGGAAQVERKEFLARLYRSQLQPMILDPILNHASRMQGCERLWVTASLARALIASIETCTAPGQ